MGKKRDGGCLGVSEGDTSKTGATKRQEKQAEGGRRQLNQGKLPTG